MFLKYSKSYIKFIMLSHDPTDFWHENDIV